MVTAVVVIYSTALLAVDQACRCLDIMLLDLEMTLEVKVTCREEDIDNQDALASVEHNKCLRSLHSGIIGPVSGSVDHNYHNT